MKITRNELKNMIAETLNSARSVLLEMPEMPIVGQEQEGSYTKAPTEYGDEDAKRSLFHMGAQSQQLHDMIQPDDGLAPEIRDNIKQSADLLEKAFKALTYEKQNPEGR
jgi:ParB-like chromosome segregation protein Spo0J|tara:strand:+ start:489 stop:815 length:327 start_codon:yes stop_codon:yes gene_type:complete